MATRVFILTSSAGGRVHLGTMHAGQKVLTRTECGRWIESNWSSLEASSQVAREDVNCGQCTPAVGRLLRAEKAVAR